MPSTFNDYFSARKKFVKSYYKIVVEVNLLSIDSSITIIRINFNNNMFFDITHC